MTAHAPAALVEMLEGLEKLWPQGDKADFIKFYRAFPALAKAILDQAVEIERLRDAEAHVHIVLAKWGSKRGGGYTDGHPLHEKVDTAIGCEVAASAERAREEGIEAAFKWCEAEVDKLVGETKAKAGAGDYIAAHNSQQMGFAVAHAALCVRALAPTPSAQGASISPRQ